LLSLIYLKEKILFYLFSFPSIVWNQ